MGDDALRVTASGGVLIPPNEYAGELPDAFGSSIELIRERIAEEAKDSKGKDGTKEAP